MAKAKNNAVTDRRNYWQEQIAKASKRWGDFHTSGDIVIDRYRIEAAASRAAATASTQDRFNVLYSTTETMRPSLYAQTPKIEAKRRHRDRTNPVVAAATQLLESCVTYAFEETDFDDVMENVVEDYTLPGMGVAWVRYVPTFKPELDDAGNQTYEEDGKTPRQLLDFEALGLDYINWKDVLMGLGRTWPEVPWVAKKVYFDKEAATKRFGADKASQLQYDEAKADKKDESCDDKQAVIWEIWDKKTGKVIWFSENFPGDVLDEIDDPLKLKGFFPTPRPLRAISNTRTMVPRPFYAQYQAQAEHLDKLTNKIRILSEALNVRGVYDQQMTQLQHMLSSAGGNKMIGVENWQQFVQNGGMVGSVQFLPIKEVAQVLMELLKARETCKNEIYEITGFSDIVRGSSKASETLGAQQIKQDWASARLKKMQKEVQRYARDLIRIMAEIMAEQFTEETFALYSGFEPPADPTMAAQAVTSFKAALDLLRKERERCAQIGIETDSTILPDEAGEREDRMAFLAAIGAFLQQSGPMVQQYPEMRGLLGAIMMFTVRTFRASRPIEQEFEAFQEAIRDQPATDPNAKEGGDNGAAAAQASIQTAQIKAQSDQQTAQADAELKRYEIDRKMELEAMKEQNRHQEKMLELQIRMAELEIKTDELNVKKQEAANDAALAERDQEHQHAMDHVQGARDDAQFDAQREDAAEERQQQAVDKSKKGS